MKKLILIVLLIIVIAVCTGTWIFGFSADIFNIFVKLFRWLEKTFDFFGWNNGMLCIGGMYA